MNLKNKINQIVDHLNKDQFKKAVRSCEKIIQLKIHNTIVYNLLGLGLQKQNLFNKSIKCFEKSIQLNNKNYLAFNNLAISLKAIHKIKLAKKAYQECLNINPNYVIGIINYANLKQEENDINGSIKLYLRALEFESEINEKYIYSKLVKLYHTLGKVDLAKNYLDIIMIKNSENTSLLELYSELNNYKLEEKYLKKMETIYKNKDLKEIEIIDLSFPLARAYDGRGDFKKAFKYFKIGNDLKKKNTKYNHNDFVKLINNIKSFFQNTEIYNHKKKISDKKAIFICGMPRSGTTLLEQIISSHKDVIATGENNFVSSFINENYLNNFSLSYKKIIKDIYAKENPPQNYVLKLLDEYNFNSKVFTDKSVENFLWIGFIRIFFPNSKIILTERNAKDVCFSLYKINFKSQFMNFTYNQKDISNFYNSYIELVEFWKKLFLSDIYIAKYEKLVDEPETEIKKLINFCDLDWDSNCLQHHKNKSTIKTASINQARKPIYRSSKNISDNYSNYFEEMFGLLKI